jgi:hypothetical protein
MGKRGPQKGEGGRPKIEIDWKVFETCCKLCATESEICGVLNIHSETLAKYVNEKYGKTFPETLKSLSDKTKLSLRRNQIRMSETNPTMAIWLGKQYLGQTDKCDTTISGDKDNPLQLEATINIIHQRFPIQQIDE